MASHPCLCVKKTKDGRTVRRSVMNQPYFADQHNKQLFRFYIDETKEYFLSFELDPKVAYNDYLKTVQCYQAKPHITIERLADDDVMPQLNRLRQGQTTRILQPTVTPAVRSGRESDAPSTSTHPFPSRGGSSTLPYFRVPKDGNSGGDDDDSFVETFRYRVKETGNTFETDSLDIYESYVRWYDSLVTYVVDCDCGDSE